MSKRKKAAIVLFVDSADVHSAVDMGSVVKWALRELGVMKNGLTTTVRGEELKIEVHDVMEAGIAAGNGYLWMEPTSKAFPRKAEVDE